MKFNILLSVFLINSQAAFAEMTRSPIKNAEVFVFDAICTPTSDTEGYLTLNMRMNAKQRYIQGNFLSYSETSSAKDPINWKIISLSDCQKTQMDLLQQVGKKIILNGHYFEQGFDSYEDIIGTCKIIRTGELFPCKKGTRKIKKYKYEAVLNLGPFYILYKNY